MTIQRFHWSLMIAVTLQLDMKSSIPPRYRTELRAFPDFAPEITAVGIHPLKFPVGLAGGYRPCEYFAGRITRSQTEPGI